MKKTNEELLKFFGLKVGDEVKIEGFTTTFVIYEGVYTQYVEEIRKDCQFGSTWDIIDFIRQLPGNDYDIITPKKKIGDMKCERMLCSKCPLRATDCNSIGKTLYKALEKYIEYLNGFDGSLKPFEKTFIDALKAELDKEVQECEK